MNDETKKQDALPKLKTLIIAIIATGTVVSAVWGFFFYKMVELKNQEITILEKSEPQALQKVAEKLDVLQESIAPLTLAFPFDNFDGRVGLGSGGSGPTKVTTLLIAADNLRKERKFDLAEAKVEEIERIYPSLAGARYMRFLIERDKGNKKEALTHAEDLIAQLPDDKRILDAYEFAVKGNLEIDKKKVAEELCLRAIKLDPKNKSLTDFFKSAFGYEPSLLKNDK